MLTVVICCIFISIRTPLIRQESTDLVVACFLLHPSKSPTKRGHLATTNNTLCIKHLQSVFLSPFPFLFISLPFPSTSPTTPPLHFIPRQHNVLPRSPDTTPTAKAIEIDFWTIPRWKLRINRHRYTGSTAETD
jgi:hypothetical protein